MTKKQIKKLLETPFWPEDLETKKVYFRTHDDCDGDKSQGLGLIITPDGDVWVNVSSKHSLRFRTTFGGGGLSGMTRNALLLLALAIKMDNEEKRC